MASSSLAVWQKEIKIDEQVTHDEYKYINTVAIGFTFHAYLILLF